MRIVLFIDGHNGCSWYRALTPGRLLAREGGHEVLASIKLEDVLVREADVIVFQKRFMPKDVEWMERCLQRKKKVVLEFDDDYLTLPSWNGTAHIFKKIKRAFMKALKLSPTITVTTEHLKSRYDSYGSEVHVLPNSVDLVRLEEEKEKQADLKPKAINHANRVDFTKLDGFKIGWAGSATHTKDMELIQDSLVRFAKRCPKAKIFMMGACSNKVLHTIPRKQLFLIEGVPVNQYLPTLAKLGLDIGLAPLVDEEFNLSKSNLKLVEYMALGIIPLASSIGEYERTLRGEEAGFLCTSPQEWELRLWQLFTNRLLQEKLRRNGRALVERDYDIGKNWSLWEKVYFP